ncbi:MAG: hypothetical protein Q9219_005758 [cf. Caloplaca sp. 3 TL-2023]
MAGSLTTQVNQSSAHISPLAPSQMQIIGEARQIWAPLRRKYNLYLFHRLPSFESDNGTNQMASGCLSLSSPRQLQVSQAAQQSSIDERNQFAYVDEPLLSWDFSLRSADSQLIGSVNRNWGGIGRELFTDTGVYALRMDAAGPERQPPSPSTSKEQNNVTTYEEQVPAMTLDQRAVMLAAAVTIDFDYFSRHSGAGGGMGWMPLWFPMGGGEAAAGGEAPEGAGVVGGIVEESFSREGNAAAGAAGMGAMTGYEAIRGGSGGDGNMGPWENAPQYHSNRGKGGDEGMDTSEGTGDGRADFWDDIF